MNTQEIPQYLLPALFIGFFAWRLLKFKLSKARFPELLKQGAVIVDVRSKQEFSSGSVQGSINIPLDSLTSSLSRLDKAKPVILCCASGTRSGMGAAILKRNGFTQVVNGGPWTNLLGLLLTLFILSGSPHALAEDQAVSGTIEKGLRILTLSPKQKQPHFTVYRGDYVKFRIEGSQPSPENTPPLKMTQVGTFPFTQGKTQGDISVIEYARANYQAVSAQQARELIDSLQLPVIDVRTPGEFSQGHLPGAILIPVQEIQNRLTELEKYKSQDVLIYCASGNRSTVASKILVDHGFKRIYNLRGGITDWTAAGHAIEK